MKVWTISVGRDKFFLNVYTQDLPWWKEAAEDGWNKICEATQGWAGGHGMPELFWKIPVGLPRRFPDGGLRNSVAGFFYGLESKILSWTDDERFSAIQIEIDKETARKLSPDFVETVEGWEREEDEAN